MRWQHIYIFPAQHEVRCVQIEGRLFILLDVSCTPAKFVLAARSGNRQRAEAQSNHVAGCTNIMKTPERDEWHRNSFSVSESLRLLCVGANQGVYETDAYNSVGMARTTQRGSCC